MSLERVSFSDREAWLAGRTNGIGASEAAAVVGMSPFMTPMQLWRRKMGIDQSPDLSGVEAVERGNRMEPALRAMFAASHPEMAVEYHQFDILFQSERPWLFATLDAELILPNGERGVLEIKTCAPNGRAGWLEWADGHVKQGYAVQVTHQLLATGYSFAYLYAALYAMNGDITIREYEFPREDREEDIRFLLHAEVKFWDSVCRGVMPPTPLTM